MNELKQKYSNCHTCSNISGATRGLTPTYSLAASLYDSFKLLI